ncbi:uncharacterized protein [Tiliqua scincoides]|uniref:uncharacterized protein n=1 Tax=Tiliqua scincoides TaxID=71010 RepID=UPI00346234F6
MALEEGDPSVLKRSVLHLVLQHPEGVKFGDFSGAFLQLHGFHPQLALHGYRSLKDLVTEMKNFVVLEGDSQNPVIKVASDFDLYQWLEGGEENGWDDSEEEVQSLSDEEAETEEEAEILELLTNILTTYQNGLRIEKVREFLLAKNRVDLEKFSIDQGYKDTLEFLEHRIPELTIKYQENRLKCVVQLTAGEMQPPISSSSCKKVRTSNHHTIPQLLISLLSTYKTGLRIEKVQEFLLARNGVNLEKFSISQGYKDTLEFLEHRIPELTIKYRENRLKCVVQLIAGAMQPPVSSTSCKKVLHAGPTISSSCPPPLQDVPLDSSKIAQNPKHNTEKNRTQRGREPPPSTNHAVSQVKALLSAYKLGLRTEKVQEFLLAKNGVDLEKFSIAQGYKDTLEFLVHQMPELTIKYQKNRLKCVLQLTAGTAREMQPPVSSSSSEKVLHTGLTIPLNCPPPPQNVPLDASETAQNPVHSTEKNRTLYGAEPPPSTNHAVLQLQGLMAVEEEESAALKHSVLHLLLQHPEGVKCGEFTGAFQLLHGYHPRFALHGYRSLKDLVADMKDVVVVEGDAQNKVIKLAKDLSLSQWLEGGEENRWDDSEVKGQSLSCEEAVRDDAEILEFLTKLLSNYKYGLKIKRVQEFLLANSGVDLEKISIAQGYKDTLEFLEHRIPEVTIQYRENRLKCVVQLTAGSAGEMQPLILSSSCEKVLQTGLTTSSSCSSPPQDVPLDSSKTALTDPRTEKNRTENGTETPPATNHAVPQLQEQIVMEKGDPGALKRNVLHLVLQHPEGVTFGDFSGAFQQLHGYCPQLALHGYCSLKDLLTDMKDVVVVEGDSQNQVIKVASDSHLDHWLEGGEENGLDDSEEEARSLLYEASAGEDAEILELLTKLLSKYKHGLKIKRVQEFLLANSGVDLEKISIAQGYKDTLEFLEHRIPEVTIQYRENRLKCVVRLTAGAAGEMQLPIPSCSYEKVLQTGLTTSSSCSSPSQNVPLDSSKTAQNPDPRTEKNRTENGTQTPPATNHAIPQLQEQIVMEKGDPGALKRNVLHLVLQHPEGVKFGDFSGAFQQLHGYCPQLALHGYCSLKDLLTDMKDVVVVEGDSLNQVIKVASDSHLDHWLEGGEENGLDDSGEEARSLSYEASAGEDAEILELLTNLLTTYQNGLRIEKIQEYLLAKNGVDLEKFSIAQGYKDALEFLEHRMPELTIKYQKNRLKCVVQLTAGTAGEMQPPVSSSSCEKVLQTGLTVSLSCPPPPQNVPLDSSKTAQNPKPRTEKNNTQNNTEPPSSTDHAVPQLQGQITMEEGDLGALKRNVLHLVLQHPEGVTFGDFSGAFQQLHGYCPQLTCHGYHSLRDFVADLNGVVVLEGDSQNPVIKVASESRLYKWLEGEENGWDDPERKTQSLSHEEATREEEGFSIAFVAVRDVLKNHPKGLKVKKLKEALRKKCDFDLERLRSHLGYKDIVSFLQDMPGLLLRNISMVRNCVVQLQSGPSSPAPSLDTDFSACNSNATFQEPMRNKSGTHSPTPSLDTDFCAHYSDLAAALVLVLDVLGDYPLGLNLKALKENLEAKHGFDLDTFSQGLGYEDVMVCLVDIPGVYYLSKWQAAPESHHPASFRCPSPSSLAAHC